MKSQQHPATDTYHIDSHATWAPSHMTIDTQTHHYISNTRHHRQKCNTHTHFQTYKAVTRKLPPTVWCRDKPRPQAHEASARCTLTTPTQLLFIFCCTYLLFLCMQVCRHLLVVTSLWRSEDNSWKWVLLPPSVLPTTSCKTHRRPNIGAPICTSTHTVPPTIRCKSTNTALSPVPYTPALPLPHSPSSPTPLSPPPPPWGNQGIEG